MFRSCKTAPCSCLCSFLVIVPVFFQFVISYVFESQHNYEFNIIVHNKQIMIQSSSYHKEIIICYVCVVEVFTLLDLDRSFYFIYSIKFCCLGSSSLSPITKKQKMTGSIPAGDTTICYYVLFGLFLLKKFKPYKRKIPLCVETEKIYICVCACVCLFPFSIAFRN